MSNDLNPEDLSRAALLRIVQRVRYTLWDAEGKRPPPAEAIRDIETMFEAHSIGRPDPSDPEG